MLRWTSHDGEAVLYHADCMEVLSKLEAVDSCVTDPPYGIGFMGNKWDYDVPKIEMWKAVVKSLKPGAHLLSFAGTRTQHRIAVNIEDAGFEIRDTIMWVYGSGFPKSLDIGKAMDKIDGVDLEKEKEIAEYLKNRRESLGLTRAFVDDKVFNGSSRYAFVEGRNDPTGAGRIYLPTPEEWELLKNVLQLDDRFDSYIRKAIPSRKDRAKIDGGKSIEISKEDGDFGYQDDGSRWEGERRNTVPASEAANEWQGWGTALKPACEPVIVSRKPFLGTVAENVLKYGTGALNIDGCRIEYQNEIDKENATPQGRVTSGESGHIAIPSIGNTQRQEFMRPELKGRFPSNFIHDGSEEVLALFPDNVKGGTWNRTDGARPFNNDGEPTGYQTNKVDDSIGSAARFFYCAKASKDDKYENNEHPTVKPTNLMKYLCRLVTPKGGIILDPFMGSGSTGKAAILEGFRFVGIEIDKKYFDIALERIKEALEIAAGGPLFYQKGKLEEI